MLLSWILTVSLGINSQPSRFNPVLAENPIRPTVTLDWTRTIIH